MEFNMEFKWSKYLKTVRFFYFESEVRMLKLKMTDEFNIAYENVLLNFLYWIVQGPKSIISFLHWIRSGLLLTLAFGQSNLERAGND